MPHPNDPYSRPLNATQPHHAPLYSLYGQPMEEVVLAPKAGNPNAVPAFGRYSSAPYLAPEDRVPAARKRKKAASTSPNTDATSLTDEQVTAPSPKDGTITEDDLFE